MSEHVEMYLVMIALLRDDFDTPVPLSLLAQNLAISPVSANEMCRKLNEQGRVEYQPYKGVTLTAAGEAEAQQILSRRRLWEMFLVQKLGIDNAEADTIACRLEHITSSALINALQDYLARAPQRIDCTGCNAATPASPQRPLSHCGVGQHGRITTISSDHATIDFLIAQGVGPHTAVTVLAIGSDGSLLLDAGQHRLTLAAALAAEILVVGED